MTILKMPSITKNLYTNVIAQRVASNVGWFLISEAVGKCLFFLITVYLARVLETAEYGLFTYAQSIVLECHPTPQGECSYCKNQRYYPGVNSETYR